MDFECDRSRCGNCRYWIGKCCHALARIEHDDRNPSACHHFTAQASRILQPEGKPVC